MLRILPRDAFNDANLLKCIAKLTMAIEDRECDFIQYHYDGEPFDIRQDESSGATYVANISFWTYGLGKSRPLHFERPLNSRESWPLFLEVGDDVFEVFDTLGNIILQPEDLTTNR